MLEVKKYFLKKKGLLILSWKDSINTNDKGFWDISGILKPGIPEGL